MEGEGAKSCMGLPYFVATDVLCMTAQHQVVLLQGRRARSSRQNITEQPLNLAC